MVINSSSLEEAYLGYLMTQINFYYSVTIIPLGIILNIISIIAFSNQPNMPHNLNLLYIFLSIYDILALLNSILFAQLLPSLGIILFNYSTFNCVFFNWWRKVAVQSPSWMQVLLTLERHGSATWINKLNFMDKKIYIFAILALMQFILIIANSSIAWFYILVSPVTTNSSLNVSSTASNQYCTSSLTVSFITDSVNLLFRFLLPFFIMLYFNISLSRNLYKSKRRVTSKTRSFRRERNYTMTIIGFNVIFCLLNTPWAVWYILMHVKQLGLVFQSSFDTAVMDLLNSIVFSIFYLNNFSTFILNFGFNRVFRLEVSRLTNLPFSRSTSRFSAHNSRHQANNSSQVGN